jgi:hypothetical protein
MKRRRRLGLFCEYWYDLRGQKLQKATKAELAEAYRLWVVHSDIREGCENRYGRNTFEERA